MNKIDENHDYVAMAVTDDASLTPSPLRVDPVTGRLEIVIYNLVGIPVANTVLPTDENHQGVSEAVTDDVNANIRPLQTDTNGYLLIDLNIE